MLTNIGSVAQPEGLSQKQGKKHLPQCCQCEQEIGHVLLLLVHQQKKNVADVVQSEVLHQG